MRHANPEKTEMALELLERENKAFREHAVWKTIGTTPDKFFKAVETHVRSLNVPKDQWDLAYKQAKESSRIRSIERRQAYRQTNLKTLGFIRV